MKTALLAAAVVLALTAVAHSFLGERYILIRLFRRDDLPRLFGSDRITKRVLRLAWHLTSIAWLGFAGILLVLARNQVAPWVTLLNVIAVTFACHAALIAFASRGKHLAWLAFGAVAILAWLAA